MGMPTLFFKIPRRLGSGTSFLPTSKEERVLILVTLQSIGANRGLVIGQSGPPANRANRVGHLIGPIGAASQSGQSGRSSNRANRVARSIGLGHHFFYSISTRSKQWGRPMGPIEATRLPKPIGPIEPIGPIGSPDCESQSGPIGPIG